MDELARTPLKAPSVLTAQENAAIRDIITAIHVGNVSSASSQWSTLITTLCQQGVRLDVNALVQYVLQQSYQQSTSDLEFGAKETQSMNNQKQQATLQMLSNISKMLYDTATKVIINRK